MDEEGLSPEPMATYRRIRLLWSWVLFTPILYLILAIVMQHYGWVETFPQARHPWDRAAAWVTVVAVTVLLLIALVWLRLRRPRVIHKLANDPAQALRRWTLNFYFMAALCELLTFTGLVYFILSGRMWAVLAGGAAAYIGYALAYPSHQELSALEGE